MIALKQVTKQYGQATVLKNITLSIDEPGIYCLLGRNGAGKTTLLKSVAGYQNITSGTIQVDSKEITTATVIYAAPLVWVANRRDFSCNYLYLHTDSTIKR